MLPFHPKQLVIAQHTVDFRKQWNGFLAEGYRIGEELKAKGRPVKTLIYLAVGYRGQVWFSALAYFQEQPAYTLNTVTIETSRGTVRGRRGGGFSPPRPERAEIPGQSGPGMHLPNPNFRAEKR